MWHVTIMAVDPPVPTGDAPLIQPSIHKEVSIVMVELTRRLVLRTSPALIDAQEFATSQGWPLVSQTQAGPDRGTVTELMWRVGSGVYFYYVESPQSDDCCVGYIIDRAKPSECDLPSLQDAFEVWSLDELLTATEQTGDPSDYAGAVLRAGLGSPSEFDQRFFDRIAAAADHPSWIVRMIAVSAMVYPGWPQFRPVLTQRRQSDPQQRVRDHAADVLDSYDRVGVGEP